MSDDFATWLARTHKTRAGGRLVLNARRDALSRCRRVEASEGDVDEHYARDQMHDLLTRFTFSRYDLAPAHRIEIVGDVYKGTATLRNALRLYQQFRESSRNARAAADTRPARG
jgi:hypothetical protein